MDRPGPGVLSEGLGAGMVLLALDRPGPVGEIAETSRRQCFFCTKLPRLVIHGELGLDVPGSFVQPSTQAARSMIPGVVEGFTMAASCQAFELEVTIASSSVIANVIASVCQVMAEGQNAIGKKQTRQMWLGLAWLGAGRTWGWGGGGGGCGSAVSLLGFCYTRALQLSDTTIDCLGSSLV